MCVETDWLVRVLLRHSNRSLLTVSAASKKLHAQLLLPSLIEQTNCEDLRGASSNLTSTPSARGNSALCKVDDVLLPLILSESLTYQRVGA